MQVEIVGEQSNHRSAEYQPQRVHSKSQQHDQGRSRERCRLNIHQRSPSELPRDNSHQRQRSNVHTVQESRSNSGLADSRHQRTAGRNQQERWKKNANRRDNGPAHAAENVTNEGCGGEDRAGSNLTHGNGVCKLNVGQPSSVCDKIVMQKCQQNITAAKDNRSQLEEHEKQ